MDEVIKFVYAEQKWKIQLILDMYKNGMSIEDIAKFTSLGIEEIRKILQV